MTTLDGSGGRTVRGRIRRMKRLVFIVWLMDSVLLVWLFIYILLQGSTPDRIQLAGDLGAAWGITAAFLIGPFWKAIRQWPARRKAIVLSGVFIIVVVAGGSFWVRVRQTTKLQMLFKEDQEIERDAAPKKQRFMQLLSEKESAKTLPEYLQRCAELEPSISDYETSERQVDDLLGQMQQEIGELKPQGSYGRLLPGFAVLRLVFAKDIEGVEAERKEIGYAEQLPNIPEAGRAQFYTSSIQHVVEQESKIAQDETAILKDAKARGVTLPESVYQGAGIK
jgi:hypothetical protein